MEGYCWVHLGQLAQSVGELDRARVAFERSLALRVATGERYGILNSLEMLMRLSILERKFTEATELLGAVDTLREEMGAKISPVEQEDDTQARRALQAALSPELFLLHYEQGRHQPRSLLLSGISSRSA